MHSLTFGERQGGSSERVRAILASLQGAGFDVVSVANNHSGDYGPGAFADMLGNLPQYDITAIGGGLNHDAAHTPVVVERFGTRIGFVLARSQPQV